MEHRVQKIISQAGITSRRKAEDLIREKKVKVNGKVIILGAKADPTKDKITVNGKLIKIENKVYFMVNKPKGVLSSTQDEWKRKIVVDLVPSKEKLFLVGRLDLDAQGLIILTNDGELTNKVTHPRYEVHKTYQVTLNKPLTVNNETKLKKGIRIDQRTVKTKNVKVDKNKVTLTIHEGRKHIVKRLFEELGYKVNTLKRIQIGKLKLGSLQIGKCQKLTKDQVRLLTA